MFFFDIILTATGDSWMNDGEFTEKNSHIVTTLWKRHIRQLTQALMSIFCFDPYRKVLLSPEIKIYGSSWTANPLGSALVGSHPILVTGFCDDSMI